MRVLAYVSVSFVKSMILETKSVETDPLLSR